MKEYLIPLENDIISSYALLAFFAGLFITIRLGFPQFRYLLLSLKILSGATDDKGSKGQLVHSQSFFAGTSSSLLFGAIIGSALALSLGGIGVLFWIWISAIVAMPLRIVNSTLAIKFRTKLSNGRILSGPMYFIQKALRADWLAIAFAMGSLGTVLTLGGIVPTLSLTYIADKAFGLKGLSISIFLSAILIYVSLGGIRRIGRLAGFLVPTGLVIFFVFYFLHFNNSLTSFFQFLGAVFRNAFRIDSIVGGGLYAVFAVLGKSIGGFYAATETGVGKSGGISGVVRTDYPFKQGLVAMLSLAFEGIVISTLVFYLLYSNNAVNLDDQIRFMSSMLSTGDTITGTFLISSIFFLGTVSVISWFYTGQQNSYFILGEGFANTFRIVFLTFLIGSSYLYLLKGDDFLVSVFRTGYLMAVFTAIPVLVSIVILSKQVKQEMNKFIAETGARYEVSQDFYILLLSVLPKNLISKLFGMFTYIKLPRFLMIPILKAFAKLYKINVSEAELNIQEYNSLNQFFTRALKAGARIIDSAENAVVSPVDARITNYGDINDTTLIQAKGIDFNVRELIGSEKYFKDFENGKFMTLYLSPQDYHRIHSPFYGKVLGYYYEPGKLFPVNDLAVIGIKSLFPKNERLITFLQTEFGKIAVVKVGASNVGKIRVTYDNKIVTNSWIRFPKDVDYKNVNIFIDKGAELGRFEMGSTVILIFERNTIDFLDLPREEKIQYGSTIGTFRKKLLTLPK
ncbi:MAG: archaetidylserine decarboxylase [Leptospiraceae bacterium]|nr:archaetidylserine decarboxylase [Leptospiraceae bacterium]